MSQRYIQYARQAKPDSQSSIALAALKADYSLAVDSRLIGELLL